MRRLVILCLLILCLVLAGCEPQQPSRPRTFEPSWTSWPPMRGALKLGPVVSDVESHLPTGFFPAENPYRDADRITWVHEGTHGIHGRLRDHFQGPAFYVLRNKAARTREPFGTLEDVATVVPASLQGNGYDLYLVQAQGEYNDRSSYIFNEWTAYTNGSEARLRLGIVNRSETVGSMMEFCNYALCVPYATRDKSPQMRAFIGWQIQRALTLYHKSGVRSDALTKLRTAPDAAGLRKFAQGYFGPTWTRRTLGF